ncbi:cell filamentation protein [Mariniradius saccharolyticus AK6]|uniref:protein adenylyltransferase n=1 Tax=Mariniradius saccharolyticus AK6 TaxID=1239962 RepID=M7XF69_9BACT|nr:Fic family protein [Mariniradius saccharolyticus]EMS33514.1 cell filamentation protein [Mariniradius saccharolyticus AK6]
MSDAYKYIDFDYTYTDPKTGILKNLRGITDPDVLLFVESAAVTKRLQELYNNPIKIKGIENLFDIHNHLFQDMYVWAGKKRIVEISKDGKQFFPTSHFDNARIYINSLIADFKKIPKNRKRELAEKLAEILDNVNYFHPFREGNGRAQREFLRSLALEKGLILNLNPPNNKSVYERYMKGTIESDLVTLKELIFELVASKNRE